MSEVKRPAMPIKSRLPDNLNAAYEQAYAYAVELEKVWAPKVNAYMDKLEAENRELREMIEKINFMLIPDEYERVFDKLNKLEAENRELQTDLGINRGMLRYISSVLTGDGDADPQLAADRVAAENRELKDACLKAAHMMGNNPMEFHLRTRLAKVEELLREIQHFKHGPSRDKRIWDFLNPEEKD